MKTPNHFASSLKCVGFAIGAAFLTSCSTPSIKPLDPRSVRRLDFAEAPQAKVLGPQLRQAGDRWYPRICALLADGNSPFPPRFDICLKKQLQNDNLGEARMRQVCLNANYLDQFQRQPDVLEQVLVHEAAHVAQHYYRPIIGRWLAYNPRPPGCWQEGIADYVCFKLGLTKGWRCAECGSAFPHYRDGYSCAGAFLLYVERFDSSIVPQLNTVLRQGHYSDAFFLKRTGKALPALWADFQRTAAFTPSAARMLQLQQELGFVEGRPPQDIEQRLKQFLDQHADARTKSLINYAHIPGMKRTEVKSRLALVYYFTQPGGTAEAYMVKLQENEELPGFAKGEHGTLTGLINSGDLNTTFPAIRSFSATKQGDASIYHYTVVRPGQETDWRLERAWRTHSDGHIIKEYSIP